MLNVRIQYYPHVILKSLVITSQLQIAEEILGVSKHKIEFEDFGNITQQQILKFNCIYSFKTLCLKAYGHSNCLYLFSRSYIIQNCTM